MEKFDINNIRKISELKNEYDLEKASTTQAKLRWMIKEDPSLEPVRKHLIKLIREYENHYWSGEEKVSEERIKEKDKAEEFIDLENKFITQRKHLIKETLKKHGLSQQDFAKILGHRKNYMSELINGLRSFSKKDLIIINRLLKIKFEHLIPPFIKGNTIDHILETLKELNKPELESELNKVDIYPEFV